jgi:hypothetical protein
MPVPGIVFAAGALVQVGVALAVVRRKIPARRYDQSVEGYWSANEVRGPSIMLWSLLEGAGLFSAVGYLLTGGTLPGTVALIALFVLVSVRPSRLEDEGAA